MATSCEELTHWKCQLAGGQSQDPGDPRASAGPLLGRTGSNSQLQAAPGVLGLCQPTVGCSCILGSSGGGMIFPMENFPFPMGAPAPRSSNRRLRPNVARMCQPPATMIGSEPTRGEAKDSALLSSRDAGRLEPPERPQGSPASSSVWRDLSQSL